MRDNTMKPETRIFIISIIIFLLSCLVGYIDSAVAANSGTTTTVILIRHAERDNFFILTDAGHERAKALIDAVGDMSLKAIYSPDLARDLDTVRPLANQLGIEITLTPRISKAVVDQIVSEILTRHPGEVVLLVGNGSGNLRSLHHRLGGTGEGPYPYGDLFIYTIPDQGPVKVIKSKYGS
jgi:hypothetical protein